MLKDGTIIVATGGGIVCALKAGTFKPIAQKECSLAGGATSIAVRGIGHQLYVGVNKGNIYRINFSDFQPTCINSCHYSGVSSFLLDCTPYYTSSKILVFFTSN